MVKSEPPIPRVGRPRHTEQEEVAAVLVTGSRPVGRRRLLTCAHLLRVHGHGVASRSGGTATK